MLIGYTVCDCLCDSVTVLVSYKNCTKLQESKRKNWIYASERIYIFKLAKSDIRLSICMFHRLVYS